MTPEIEQQLTTAVLLDYIDSEIADLIRSHRAVYENDLNAACDGLVFNRDQDQTIEGFEDLYSYMVHYPRVK